MADPFRRSAVAAGPSSAAPAATTTPTGLQSPVNFAAARGEIGDAFAGRVSLAMLDLILLGLIAFYLWTRTAQGGS